MALNATAFPTPRMKSEAVITGEMTVATDWDVVVSPNAVPTLPLQLSTISACIIGKIELLKKPMISANTRFRIRFGLAKNTAYANSTAREIDANSLFRFQMSDRPPITILPIPPEIETNEENRAAESIPKWLTVKK